MAVVTVMDVTRKVLEVIQQNRNDGGMMLSGDGDVSPNAIMYSYGTMDEFKVIVLELETTFDIEIEDNDIGELTVQAFMEIVINKAIRENEI